MRTVLHIGMAKTGSTALQDCLSRSRSYLLSCGVLYPENTAEVRFNNHRLLVQPLLDYEGLPPSMRRVAAPDELEAWHANFVAFVREQVEASRPDCLLLSAEHLFRALAGDRPELLLRDLEAMGAGQVEVCVYVRRPSENFLSLCQQRLRTSSAVKQPAVPNYRKTLGRCVELFGRDHVNVRLFSRGRMVDGDVVADFCATLLEAEGVERGQLAQANRANETVGAESMDILRRYRGDFDADRNSHHTDGAKRLFHALCFAEAALGATRPKLNPAIADLIDYSSDQIPWLRDQFGIEFPGLDYGRLEREGPVQITTRTFALDEMVEIDRDVRDRLLREIDTIWTAGDARREAWVAGILNETARA